MASSPPDRAPSDGERGSGPQRVANDAEGMELALAQAHVAFAEDEVPVGAVVVLDGLVLALGHNQTRALCDPTAHAEVLALRDAAAVVGHWRLIDCTLYVTLEPCAMCAGAIVSARVDRVVYGATDPKAGAVRSLFHIADDDRLNHRAAVESGVLGDESSQRLKAFFAARRGRSGLADPDQST